jgi:hypothetical protein
MISSGRENVHRVIQQHLKDFQNRFELHNAQSKDFESFVNYCLLRTCSGDAISPDSLSYEGEDPGIDGMMFFVNDAYVSSVDELSDVFKKVRRDADVAIIATQSKTSESWDKSQINIFQSALIDFFNEEQKYPLSEYLIDKRDMFNLVIENVGKIRDGKPRVSCYFATTAGPVRDVEIAAAISSISGTLSDTGLFSGVEAVGLDRDQLVSLWNKADGPVEAKLSVFADAAFPKTPGVEESYVVTAKAKDFVEKVLSDQNGNLRKKIFEENVRDYIGLDEEVNAEIGQTLSDPNKQKRFGMLNNGVTIVSPDVKLQSKELYIRDFQIVNGCQTSHLLYEYRHLLSDDVTVMLKVIETDNTDIVDDIVRSTNRQTKVQDDQFLATLDCVKGIERFFDARGADEEHRLFFERRKNQFWDEAAPPAIRVFDIREVARCAGAMFFDRADLASRYPNRLTGELSSLVFKTENIEDIYYTAAFCLYRLKLHFSNSRMDKKFVKFKWHLLMMIKYFVIGADIKNVTSQKIRSQCNEIYEFMNGGDQVTIEKLRTLCDVLEPIADVTRDRLKGQSYVQEVKARALEVRS